ncbi:MAG: hypothetical protein AB4426_26335 [Xenococcaceae cyanobacterium]
MSEDSIHAHQSQGFINDSKGNVEQDFGDKTNYDTGGGDVAERDIDKRTIINLILPEASSDNVFQELLKDVDISRILSLIDQESIQQAYQDSRHPDAGLWSSEATNIGEILKELEEFRQLFEFFERLSQDVNLSRKIRQKLKYLTGKLPSKNSPGHPINKSSNNPFPNNKGKLESYILATLVHSDDDSEQFFLNAWLIIDDSVEGLSKFESLLDQDEQQQGELCLLHEIPTLLNKFLKKSLKRLRGKKYHLTIEFFLPSALICTEVDRWKISDPIDDEITLGIKYPIRLRSIERLNIDYLDSYLYQWYEHWDKVKQVLNEKPIKELFEHLKRMESFNWKLLRSNLKQKIGLKLTCAPPKAKRKDLFKAILTAATPIAIWTRCNIPNLNQVTEIDTLLSCRPLCHLCESVREMREKADAQTGEHLGFHLAVLWENTYRLTPDLMVQLIPPGQ